MASRLGYRITTRFVRIYFGRVFDHPHAVFTDEMLRPELQDMGIFVDGMDNICATHRRVAESYFNDGCIDVAVPPLKALLHIMAYGSYEGKTLEDPSVRALFTKEHMLASSWYAERLAAKQTSEASLWTRHVKYLETYLDRPNYTDTVSRFSLKSRLAQAKAELKRVESPAYLAGLRYTLGLQPTA